MRFLLDTDTLSFALRGKGEVGTRLRASRPSDVAMSAITAAELHFGVRVRKSRKLARAVERLLAEIPVVPFGPDAAAEFGTIAANLSTRGVRVGIADELIAAHALSLGVTLVTHNHRHFGRIRGLKIEDWYEG